MGHLESVAEYKLWMFRVKLYKAGEKNNKNKQKTILDIQMELKPRTFRDLRKLIPQKEGILVLENRQL